MKFTFKIRVQVSMQGQANKNNPGICKTSMQVQQSENKRALYRVSCVFVCVYYFSEKKLFLVSALSSLLHNP